MPHGSEKRIDPDTAAVTVPAGDPLLAHGDTIYLTVVDKDRNCCSLIQSLYFGFGSQIVPGDVGFALQNRGCLFALDEEHLNRFEPQQTAVFIRLFPGSSPKTVRPWLSFGSDGAEDMQPQRARAGVDRSHRLRDERSGRRAMLRAFSILDRRLPRAFRSPPAAGRSASNRVFPTRRSKRSRRRVTRVTRTAGSIRRLSGHSHRPEIWETSTAAAIPVKMAAPLVTNMTNAPLNANRRFDP